LVRALGYQNNEEAIHQGIVFKAPQEVKGEIIGVIKNYHQRSLKEPYDPILYYYPAWNNWNYFSVQVNANNLNQEIVSIENLYKNIFAGNPFEYFFLDESFNRQYLADQRFGKVLGLFTVIAIIVACLGLLGLSSFVIKLRTKEIGIRKVLGATVYSILVLFSKDFVKLVCVASLIAIPIIYFTGTSWLRNYAFHIHLGWLIFVLPPLLLLAICLITISLQSITAALANPVKNLRTE
jgi:putative ABC transport system permease protein